MAFAWSSALLWQGQHSFNQGPHDCGELIWKTTPAHDHDVLQCGWLLANAAQAPPAFAAGSVPALPGPWAAMTGIPGMAGLAGMGALGAAQGAMAAAAAYSDAMAVQFKLLSSQPQRQAAAMLPIPDALRTDLPGA